MKAHRHPRHLASTWGDTFLPPTHPLTRRRLSPQPTILNTIDHLVLLDLLGNSHSRIYSYYRETDWLHGLMGSADERLRAQGLVEVDQGEEGWFGSARMHKGMIEDDHIPVCLLVPFRIRFPEYRELESRSRVSS
jgi:glutaminyl-peptide cyclotransferase